ncbi:hypothetical protein HMPREF9098_1651 [Kingella denitrificans ATCC 33394]|uniref:Uncharacterized protein n=1 Tax=Kingella denitrificans ATCC 33394 TaxID=888741 RepID=F0F0L6_9NEIS|nr:hypothetical protein HMPREF9098_1651 [Kingella denitrificans ATCC 33394]
MFHYAQFPLRGKARQPALLRKAHTDLQVITQSRHCIYGTPRQFISAHCLFTAVKRL